MTFTEFIRRLLTHAALAGMTWLIVILMLETLLPGFITPFVNVAGCGLVVFLLCAVALFCKREA